MMTSRMPRPGALRRPTRPGREARPGGRLGALDLRTRQPRGATARVTAPRWLRGPPAPRRRGGDVTRRAPAPLRSAHHLPLAATRRASAQLGRRRRARPAATREVHHPVYRKVHRPSPDVANPALDLRTRGAAGEQPSGSPRRSGREVRPRRVAGAATSRAEHPPPSAPPTASPSLPRAPRPPRPRAAPQRSRGGIAAQPPWLPARYAIRSIEKCTIPGPRRRYLVMEFF